MAKKISLIVKVFLVVFACVCFILKGCGKLSGISVGDIGIIVGVIAAIFGDISVNTAIDKFKQKTDVSEPESMKAEG